MTLMEFFSFIPIIRRALPVDVNAPVPAAPVLFPANQNYPSKPVGRREGRSAEAPSNRPTKLPPVPRVSFADAFPPRATRGILVRTGAAHGSSGSSV